MLNNEYGSALKKWVSAQKRIEAAEERIRATFIDLMFRPDQDEQNTAASRPCINVTPPKQPKK